LKWILQTDVSDGNPPAQYTAFTPVHTKKGEKFVWSTFSDDQIDVNFANPDVLFEYLDIFFYYLSRGLSVIRLDAVAFIWKELGTNCIHLEQTHEIVKLMRTMVDCFAPETTIITETNVPHKENISYFGDGDETHMVYQFSLPPLLLHAILTENAVLSDGMGKIARSPSRQLHLF
jgi:glycosidase